MADTPLLDAAAVAAIAARYQGEPWDWDDPCYGYESCELPRTDIRALLATLAHAHALLDALVATIPLESAYTYPQCAYCDGLQTPQTTAHTATCPWGQAWLYRDAAKRSA